MPEYTDDFIKLAHKKSSCHKHELINSDLCGCFYCISVFDPSDITEFITEDNGGETALCPHCGIDSVLSCELPIDDPEFLKAMRKYWF